MDAYKPYGCKYCDIRFKQEHNLIRHLKNFHPENSAEKTKNDNIMYVKKSITGDGTIVQTMDVYKAFDCKYCNSRFINNRNLQKHLRKYHQDHSAIVYHQEYSRLVRECNICSKVFRTKFSLERHKKNIHSDIYNLLNLSSVDEQLHINSDDEQLYIDTDDAAKCNIVINKLQTKEPETCIATINEDNSILINIKDTKELIVCQVCDKEFNRKRKYELTRHMEKVHFVEITKPIKCCVPGCSKSFNRLQQLRKHLMDLEDSGGHNYIIEKEENTFNNIQEFNQWKEDIEENDSTRYTLPNKPKINKDGSFTRMYSCSRSGTYRYHGNGKRSLKSQGTNKIGVYCPSTMDVYRSSDGIVKCKYYKTHIGHGTSGKDIMHIPIHKRDKRFIVEKIRQGVEIKRILEDLHIKGGRSAYIERKDIWNICKNFNDVGAENIEKPEQQLIDEDCIEEEAQMLNENFNSDKDEREKKIEEANTILNRIKSSLNKHSIEHIDEMIDNIKKFDSL